MACTLVTLILCLVINFIEAFPRGRGGGSRGGAAGGGAGENDNKPINKTMYLCNCMYFKEQLILLRSKNVVRKCNFDKKSRPQSDLKPNICMHCMVSFHQGGPHAMQWD